MTDVFVSYARSDKARVAPLVAALEAQAEREVISGANRSHYCGAYWGYGFHEDGVRSAHAVAAELAREG